VSELLAVVSNHSNRNFLWGFLKYWEFANYLRAPQQLQQDIKTAISSMPNRVLKCVLWNVCCDKACSEAREGQSQHTVYADTDICISVYL